MTRAICRAFSTKTKMTIIGRFPIGTWERPPLVCGSNAKPRSDFAQRGVAWSMSN
jgi:hypothetical protein